MAWRKFKLGKDRKVAVMWFERHLEDNLFSLYYDLKSRSYRHGEYQYFTVSDPKKRDIHKAAVRDRVVHQALYDYLVKVYNPIFIDDSYSSRLGKGTYKAVARLKNFTDDLCRINRGECLAIKCDIRKFFDNIDHNILLNLLDREIKDHDIMWLVRIIVKSFKVGFCKGIPLGNITSQIFANIYLNELDYFVKSRLKLRHYVRYNDDFILLSEKKSQLCRDVEQIRDFLSSRLLLAMPSEKIIFRKLSWGIDFCGYIILSNALLLRQRTKKRMMKNLRTALERYERGNIPLKEFCGVINSYVGLLKHCHSYNIMNKIRSELIYGKII